MTINRNLSKLAEGANSSGVLAVTNGGTGITSLTAGYIPYGNGTSAFSSSSGLYFSGTNLGVGTSSPSFPIDSVSSSSSTIGLNIRGRSADNIGAMSFSSNDGATQYAYLQTIVANTLAIGTNGTERMRIDSNGFVGIGATPAAWRTGVGLTALQISGGSLWSYASSEVNLAQNYYYGTGGTRYYSTSAAASGYYQGGGQHTWQNAPSGTAGAVCTLTDRMTLDASGRLLVGRTSSDANGYFLQLNGTSGYQSGVLMTYAGVGSAAIWENSSGALAFGNDGASGTTERMRISSAGGFSVGTTADPGAGAIYATGNITAYYSSDRRLKENIKDVDGALGIVSQIGSKTFDWTDAYIASKGGEDGYFVQKSDFGVVAQDVQAVFPQAVRTRQDGTLAVDYEKLATLAFGAIKELAKRVEALEAK